MKNLRKFNTEQEYNSSTKVNPQVSLVADSDKIHYDQPVGPEPPQPTVPTYVITLEIDGDYLLEYDINGVKTPRTTVSGTQTIMVKFDDVFGMYIKPIDNHMFQNTFLTGDSVEQYYTNLASFIEITGYPVSEDITIESMVVPKN